jgi:hypothetical protein
MFMFRSYSNTLRCESRRKSMIETTRPFRTCHCVVVHIEVSGARCKHDMHTKTFTKARLLHPKPFKLGVAKHGFSSKITISAEQNPKKAKRHGTPPLIPGGLWGGAGQGGVRCRRCQRHDSMTPGGGGAVSRLGGGGEKPPALAA